MKKLDINNYLPQLQEEYQKELFERIAGILKDKGIVIGSNQELEVLFRERIKKHSHEGITTLLLDGIEFCAYSQLNAKVVGSEIKTSYKFAAI